MQTAFYAAAFYEMTGIKIKQTVLIVMSDKANLMVETSNPYIWLKRVIELRKKFS